MRGAAVGVQALVPLELPMTTSACIQGMCGTLALLGGADASAHAGQQARRSRPHGHSHRCAPVATLASAPCTMPHTMTAMHGLRVILAGTAST